MEGDWEAAPGGHMCRGWPPGKPMGPSPWPVSVWTAGWEARVGVMLGHCCLGWAGLAESSPEPWLAVSLGQRPPTGVKLRWER